MTLDPSVTVASLFLPPSLQSVAIHQRNPQHLSSVIFGPRFRPAQSFSFSLSMLSSMTYCNFWTATNVPPLLLSCSQSHCCCWLFIVVINSFVCLIKNRKNREQIWAVAKRNKGCCSMLLNRTLRGCYHILRYCWAFYWDCMQFWDTYQPFFDAKTNNGKSFIILFNRN